MTIGVFDSGVGGENVVRNIKNALPEAKIVFKNDRKNLPYGDKTPEQILGFMTPIMDSFVRDGVDAIVVACNTASTNVLTELKKLVAVPVVGFVPMIKPACKATKTNVITVCATPGTLQSKRYAELKAEFGGGVEIIEPNCSDWAKLIEDDAMDEARIKEVIEISRVKKADVIVLGCTHYHWIYELLDELSGDAIEVMQSTRPVVNELKRLLGL